MAGSCSVSTHDGNQSCYSVATRQLLGMSDTSGRSRSSMTCTTLDIVMQALTGGRERAPAEYCSLLEQAGFGRADVIPDRWGVQLVEARAIA